MRGNNICYDWQTGWLEEERQEGSLVFSRPRDRLVGWLKLVWSRLSWWGWHCREFSVVGTPPLPPPPAPDTVRIDSIEDRHIGQTSSWTEHWSQKPLENIESVGWDNYQQGITDLWLQGTSFTLARLSKQRVQAFSFTLSRFMASSLRGLGRISFSSWDKTETLLNDWNSRSGGWMKGRQPKLNFTNNFMKNVDYKNVPTSHCWNDMKLAAGKKPELVLWKTCLKGWSWSPLRENMSILLSMSMKQPTTSPAFHLGRLSWLSQLALNHINWRHPS